MAASATTRNSGKAVVRTIASDTFTDENGKRHINDIRFANGHFVVASGDVAYSQAIGAILRTRLGELRQDTERGIPYFETVFLSRRKLEAWASAVRRAVEKEDFVDSISSFEYAIDDSRNVLDFTITVAFADGSEETIEESVLL